MKLYSFVYFLVLMLYNFLLVIKMYAKKGKYVIQDSDRIRSFLGSFSFLIRIYYNASLIIPTTTWLRN